MKRPVYILHSHLTFIYFCRMKIDLCDSNADGAYLTSSSSHCKSVFHFSYKFMSNLFQRKSLQGYTFYFLQLVTSWRNCELVRRKRQ
jgi:hypothetical protein